LFEAERREGIVRLPPRPFVGDHEKPLYDVYKDFVELVIMSARSLDGICQPWAPAIEGVSMPSWIPSLEARPFKLLPKEQVYQRVAADHLVDTA
jgi:hypothetical protein